MRAVLLPLAVAVFAGPTVAAAQHQHQHETAAPPQRLGDVRFETSCAPEVQADFNRAVALLHSFWFGAAAETFTKVAEKDPGCGIAWWGVALSRWGNPFAPGRPQTALEQGRAAIDKALAAGGKTDRERGYINAAAELFRDYEKTSHRARTLNYERAMQQVFDGNPGDSEAAAFYALAVNQTALPTDKTYAQQLKAAAILEKLFASQPDHPGVAHYLIHAYDHPPLAARALPAARRYAKIAPDAPHALHMPSHTFTRVGFWEESITTNLASADAARRAKSPGEVLHALDYQVYAYLQTAQDSAARRVLGEVQDIISGLSAKEQYGQAGLFALAAIPARIALERGAWEEAASLEVRPTQLPYIDAMTHFARAIGAARQTDKDPAAAAAAAKKLAELHAALVAAGDEYWAQQVEVQLKAARGWTAYAEGRADAAVRLLQEAAAVEDASDKAAITPGSLAPARELLGDLLLELNRPAEARAELEAVMKKEPRRFRTTWLAARAASAAGDQAAAKRYYAGLVEQAKAADTPIRPELQEARRLAGVSE